MTNLEVICREASERPLTALELQNIANRICKLDISEASQTSEDTSSAFRSFMMHMFEKSRTPQLRKQVERSLEPSDFVDNKDVLLEAFNVLTLFQIRLQSDQGEFLTGKDKQLFVVVALILIFEQACDMKAWFKPNLNNVGQVLLAKILQLYSIDDVPRLLNHRHENCNTSVFRDIIDILKVRITKKSWKCNPASVHCFISLLHKAPASEISDCLGDIFPAALLLIDDFEAHNKVDGVQCALRIIGHTTSTELRWYGRAEVLYSAVHPLMHTNDDKLLAGVLPCSLKLALILDSDKSQSHIQQSKLDELFQEMLTNMDFESKWCKRVIFAKYLSSYIEQLGIRTVKHFSRLFKVIESYLEVPHYPDEDVRCDILVAMEMIIKVTWPRISKYTCFILQMLIKLLLELTSEQSMVSAAGKGALLVKCKDAVCLLAKADEKCVADVLSETCTVERLGTEAHKCVKEWQQVICTDD